MPAAVVTKQINVEGLGSFLCIEVAPGQWCWTTPGFAWKFNERIPYPQSNTAMYAEQQYHYQLRASELRDAVIYTTGFSFGYKNGVIQGKADAEGATAMVQQVFKESLEKDKQLPPVRADNGIT